MTLKEVLDKLDSDVRQLIPIASSTGKSNDTKPGAINLEKTIAIGAPHFDTYIDESLGIRFNDANFIAFTPFIILQPLDIDFNGVEDIFSLTANLFEYQKDLPSLAIFAAKESSFKLDIQNSLGTSLLEEIMNTLSKIGDSSQTFGFAQGLTELAGSFGNFANAIGLSPVAGVSYALAGFKFSGPKIWQGGEVDTSIQITAVHDFSHEGYDKDRIRDIFDTIKLFTVPRNPSMITNPAAGNKQSTDKQQSQSGAPPQPNMNTQSNPEQSAIQPAPAKKNVESLSKLMYKYPLFCKVIYGNTGKVIYDVAMVTNFTTNYNFLNPEHLTFRNIPTAAEFSFTITPLLPFRSDVKSDKKIDDSYPVTSIEKLFDGILTPLFSNSDKEKIKTVRKVIYYGNVVDSQTKSQKTKPTQKKK